MGRAEGEAGAVRRFAGATVARLATVTPRGAPHLVPVTFALDVDGDRDGDGDCDTVWWVVDQKPKRSAALARLANIAADPRVSLLVDHYEDDWTALWWVRADGVASLAASGSDTERAIAALAARYEPYRMRRPEGPVVRVDVRRWRWWSAAGGP
ncbi:MAG: TIGR03668 family PPOX class F420-dependent oxidoreductase [Acidimicrobiales bacterium]